MDPTAAQREQFVADCGGVVGAGALRDELLTRYREPHRRYHGTAHVAHVLDTAEQLLGVHPVADPAVVRLAVWFHDAVYDVKRSDNEDASARLAATSLAGLGIASGTLERVAALVRATAHADPAATQAVGADADILLDADLAVLAAPPARYDDYVRGVRAEYAHVDDAGWRVGRAAVLEHLLGPTCRYRTATARGWDAAAVRNLGRELASLTLAEP